MPTIYKPKKKREYSKSSDNKRQKRQQIYNTTTWKNLRLAYLMKHPVSEISVWEDSPKLAEHIHHIISFLDVPEEEMLRYAYDTNNLIAVTATEHSRLHTGDLQGCRSKDEIKAKVLEIIKCKPLTNK